MIAALDATPLTLSSGGLRRYTAELARALRTQFPEDDYLLVSDQFASSRSPLHKRWWSIGLPRTLFRLRCDVFHGTDFAVPYIPACPAVMTVHDISPWMNPAWHNGAGRVRSRTPRLIGLGLSTMIITGTEAVRRQIVELFHIHPSRVAVVPDAPSPDLRRTSPHAHPRPYFLFVGTIEPRKNVPALVAAWRELRARHPVDLIVAGRRRDDGPVIAPEPGLHLVGEVTDAELAALYSGAVALVYPSLYEGFGLPVVEAMQCGTPVIASYDPALVEVSATAAIHTDALTGAMELLLTDPAERTRRCELSLARAAAFSWERTACMTREVYVEAIRRFTFTA